MREEHSRRQQFTQGSVSTMLPPSVVSGKQGSLLLQEEASSNSIAIDLEPAMNHQLMQQAMQDDTVSEQQRTVCVNAHGINNTAQNDTSNARLLLLAGCVRPIEGRDHAKHRIYHRRAGRHFPATSAYG